MLGYSVLVPGDGEGLSGTQRVWEVLRFGRGDVREWRRNVEIEE